MPVDADGNRADIISGPDSIPGRMNLGRLYGPYLNGAARDVRRQVLEELGYHRHFKGPVTIDDLIRIPEAQWQKAIGTMLEFYTIVSPSSYYEYMERLTEEERLQWVQSYINDNAPINYINIHVPDEVQAYMLEKGFGRPLFHDEMVLEIEKRFKLTYGPVSYVGRSGKRVTTKNKVRIAPLYIMELDKIADSWLAADLGKHNNFGILAAMNKADKYATPWRFTPPRNVSETEGRLFRMYAKKRMIAEIIDRSGNIAAQRIIGERLITDPEPTQIEEIVDRTKVKFGSPRSNQLTHHVFRCAGFDAVYTPEELE